MNYDLGQEENEAEIFIKQSVLDGAYLQKKKHDGEIYIVDVLQFYIHKSLFSLKLTSINGKVCHASYMLRAMKYKNALLDLVCLETATSWGRFWDF